MILHYLKIAVRQLLKYKFHSIVSAVCMALGLTLYGYIGLLLYSSIGPQNEVIISALATGNQADLIQTADLKQFIDKNIEGLKGIKTLTWHNQEADVYVEGDMETPYRAQLKGATPLYFRPVEGEKPRIIEGRDSIGEGEAIVTKGFANRVFGETSAIGKTVTLLSLTPNPDNYQQMQDYWGKTYRIVGVVKPAYANDVTSVVYMSMIWNRDVCQGTAYLEDGYSINQVSESVDAVEWKRASDGAPFKVELFMRNQYDAEYWATYAVVTLVSLLIFITGLVNFMKFMIQMFYTRQRELALRKCVGSNNRGLYALLASEVVVMLTVAFSISCVTSELVHSYILHMTIKELGGAELGQLIIWQGMAALVALGVSLLVILVPIWNLRRVGMKGAMMRKRQGTKARTAMLALQFAISVLFFGVLGLVLRISALEAPHVTKRMTYDEMGRIIQFGMNYKDWDFIRPQIEKLPEVETYAYVCDESFSKNRVALRDYIVGKDTMCAKILANGDPKYFEVFNIPMEGKVVNRDEENYVYVDKELHGILQQQEDFDGTIMLDWGRKFQIAGVIDCDITGEGDKGVYFGGSVYRRMQGTIFAVSRCEGYYYYKIKDGADIKKVKADIEAIYRQYIPETVDGYIPTVAEVVYENEKPVMMLRHLMYLLTFISLLVMVLSVYSTISLDATTRQKEIAIRKINGARSRDIVMQFLRPYVLTYMITFVVIYFSLTNFLPEYLVGSAHNTLLPLLLKVVWGIGIFVVSVGLLAITTWTKIKMIMKVNPADVVRRE